MRTFTDEDDDSSVILKNECIELNTLDQYSLFFKHHLVTVPGNRSLTAFHINIRSFSKNIDEMLVYLDSFKTELDIIVFTECWLSGGEESVTVDGFDFYATN